ncbi:hypothetical protein BC940DRAFT_336278 [Gongronella butleri]|nr:hypothetical protein BC940DRAFT_336278 [Gongronella butleri]
MVPKKVKRRSVKLASENKTPLAQPPSPLPSHRATPGKSKQGTQPSSPSPTTVKKRPRSKSAGKLKVEIALPPPMVPLPRGSKHLFANAVFQSAPLASDLPTPITPPAPKRSVSWHYWPRNEAHFVLHCPH